MRTYTVTEYERSDYDEYEENITIDDIINSLEYAKRGYIGDYNYTGEEDDFELFKIHMAMQKAIELLCEMKPQLNRNSKGRVKRDIRRTNQINGTEAL